MKPTSAATARPHIVSMCFYVKDIHETLHAFLELYGIGPWFVFERCPVRDLKYRGIPSTLELSLAVSFLDSMRIELIQQHDDNPSVFKDVAELRGYGFHHFTIQSEQFESEIARYGASGFAVVTEATSPGESSATRGVYFDTTQKLPGMTEILDPAPERLAALAQLQKIAATWDGKDPVRVQAME